MGERGGLNLYVIVNNGCVYITDPLGFTVWDYGDGALQFVGSVFIVSAGVAVIAGGALIVAPAAAVAASAAGGALILWGALKASDAGSALGAATVGYSAPDPLYVQTVQWAIETTTGSELSPQGKKYVRISYYSLDAVAACSTISISAFSTVEKLQKASVFVQTPYTYWKLGTIIKVSSEIDVKATAAIAGSEGLSMILDIQSIYQDERSAGDLILAPQSGDSPGPIPDQPTP
jgi:hypothetical protein